MTKVINMNEEMLNRGVKMTPAQWAKVPDNPRQRDTERHLSRAKHLLEKSPTHAHVSMAVCKSTGEAWKLDGHTRALLWLRRPELAPDTVLVTVYSVASETEVGELYTHFDNPVAAETPTDRTSGAVHAAGWEPKSRFFLNYGFGYGLVMAEGLCRGNNITSINQGRSGVGTIYTIVPAWLPELQALDAIEPVGQRFKSSVLAAALLTLRRRGIKPALEFWRLYNTDQGVKLEQEIDGVEALSNLVKTTRLKSRTQQEQLLTRAVSCFEAWRSHYTYKVGARRGASPKSADIYKYVEPIMYYKTEENLAGAGLSPRVAQAALAKADE